MQSRVSCEYICILVELLHVLLLIGWVFMLAGWLGWDNAFGVF